MKHFFLLLFGIVTFVAHAQVPDYLPTEGLVAWYPFNGNANDESGNGNDGENFGAVLAEDRNGDVASAYYFGMDAMIRLQSIEDYDWGFAPSTVMAWANYQGLGDDHGTIIRFDDCASSYVWGITIHESPTELVFHDLNRNGVDNHSITINPYSPSGWTHYAFVKDPISGNNKAYVNGELADQFNFAASFAPSEEGNPQLLIGSCGGWAHEFGGEIDDIAFFNRALSDEEISDIFSEVPLIYGCTDPSACNFDSNATAFEACEYGCLNCGPGTFWNDSLSLCLPSPTICNTGTYWHDETQSCMPINSCQEDLDGDGIVGINDLLQVLSSFGIPCEPIVSEWACGDPVSYNGHDYATVQIGEQCWFAENLRTELYQNDDSIPANLSDDEWEFTLDGALAVYGEDAGCSNTFDACNPIWSLGEYGRLYNWYAVDDERGLCPTGWHVPTDGEWMTLEMELGLSEEEANSEGWRGSDQGTQMKSTFGWSGGGTGTNSSGFSGLPGGYREPYGFFSLAGQEGGWWSSSPTNDYKAWFRWLSQASSNVFRDGFFSPRYGFSVRCLRDAE